MDKCVELLIFRRLPVKNFGPGLYRVNCCIQESFSLLLNWIINVYEKCRALVSVAKIEEQNVCAMNMRGKEFSKAGSLRMS